MNLVDECYARALDIMKINSTEFGFLASKGRPNCIWDRDGCIVCLGAMITGDKELETTAKRTLITLKERQTALGQMPNVVYLDSAKVNYYAVDATAWWIIAAECVSRLSGDADLRSSFKTAIEKAVVWLQYQAIDPSDLIISPPAADWMDSSVQRWGKVLYNNILYYKALLCANEIVGDTFREKPIVIEKILAWINLLFWPTSIVQEWISGWGSEFYEDAIDPKREHYLNYLSFESYNTSCDVTANCLAIIWDVADKKKQNKILKYFKERQISDPFPIKVLNPPIFQPAPSWNPILDLYRPATERNLPYCYHNAGVWPWAGGFYVAALVKTGRSSLAKRELEKLAEANRAGKKGEWEFNEWLHGKTGKPGGDYQQTWNAAGYVIAYKAVTEGIFPWNSVPLNWGGS